jgi:hypothetical protein
MDHLQFPPNEYVIDYLLPRICHVKSKDFEFVVATDIDKKKAIQQYYLCKETCKSEFLLSVVGYLCILRICIHVQ